ncbi:Tryptophan synthase beta chain 2, partial [Gonapodya sp. JEL0774]
PVRDVYRRWRPSPLYRARALEKALGTPAKIYYKYEGVSPVGSHKPNTSVPQVYYNKMEGVKKVTTETGAGQWGGALSFAGSMFGVEVEIYQVKVSYETKPYRRLAMETWGGKCFPSPSDKTDAGKKILAEDPNSPGSLGIAISEAVEACVKQGAKYCLGSVLNHVLMHQTIIGLECLKQMAIAGDYPDVIVGCTGGGSNFAGIALPYLGERFRKQAPKDFRVVAVEPSACPSLTRGRYAYDFGDTVGLTPLIKSHTLGHDFMPPSVHAGGLRYHGMSAIVSHLKEIGEIEAIAVGQKECFEAGVLFSRTEGILPAPEANHAVRGAILEALKCKETGESKVILFNLCGHGFLDLPAYDKFNSGLLEPDATLSEEALAAALAKLPVVEEPLKA